MKAGISSYTYTWSIGVPGNLPKHPMTVFQLIDKAVELNVQCVQIADNLPLHSLSNDELNRLFSYAQSKSIGLEAGTRCLIPEHIHTYLGIASQLKSPIVRIVVDHQEYEPSLDAIIKIIKDIEPKLKKENIILAIENHDRFKAREFAKIIEDVGSEWVGICLDSVNSMGAAEGLETVVEILAPYTVNLHAKEFTIKRISHQMGFQVEGLPLGEGMLPLEWIIEKVGQQCKSAILEQWTPPEKTIEETIKKEKSWAKKSIDHLKNSIDRKQ